MYWNLCPNIMRKNSKLINRNMGCIEIRNRQSKIPAEREINRNMGCIEIQNVRRRNQEPVPDKP